MNPIPVYVHAEDPLVRQGLAALLSGRPELRLMPDLEPNDGPLESGALVLLDGSDASAPAAFAEWARRGLPVVALLVDGAGSAARPLAGINGLVQRDAPVDRIVAAIVAVAHGLYVSDFELAPDQDHRGASTPESWDETLTPRESEVIELLARGLANKQIAARLGVSEHTAKFHVNSILSKLGVQSRSEAIVRAARLGLITL